MFSCLCGACVVRGALGRNVSFHLVFIYKHQCQCLPLGTSTNSGLFKLSRTKIWAQVFPTNFSSFLLTLPPNFFSPFPFPFCIPFFVYYLSLCLPLPSPLHVPFSFLHFPGPTASVQLGCQWERCKLPQWVWAQRSCQMVCGAFSARIRVSGDTNFAYTLNKHQSIFHWAQNAPTKYRVRSHVVKLFFRTPNTHKAQEIHLDIFQFADSDNRTEGHTFKKADAKSFLSHRTHMAVLICYFSPQSDTSLHCQPWIWG